MSVCLSISVYVHWEKQKNWSQIPGVYTYVVNKADSDSDFPVRARKKNCRIFEDGLGLLPARLIRKYIKANESRAFVFSRLWTAEKTHT